MFILTDSPIIKYSEKGKEFKYDKLFLNTFSEQITEYKNVPYDKLTEVDQSIALARIIKSIEVNGVPLTIFYKEQLSKWSNESNEDKIWLLINLVARDMFGSYDANRKEKDSVYLSNNLYAYVHSDGKKDFLLPPPSVKNRFSKIFNKTSNDNLLFEHYEMLKEKNEKGLLAKSAGI